MPLYEFELTHTITMTTTVKIRAANEEAAQQKADERIASGEFGLKAIEVVAPPEWESESETTYDIL